MPREEKETPMTDDLRERLRRMVKPGGYGNFGRLRNPDGPEAAAALDAAETRLAEARELLKVLSSEDECYCIFISRDRERDYETGTCPHQMARSFLEAMGEKKDD